MPANFGQGMPSRTVCFGSGSRTEDEASVSGTALGEAGSGLGQLERFGDDPYSEPYLFAPDYPASVKFRVCCYAGHNWFRKPRSGVVVCLGCGVVRCQVPGCKELAARDGEGCCDAHEREEDN